MWHHNKQVNMTFASNDSQNAWAQIDTLGWRRVKPGSPDGTTNLYALLVSATANDRLVSVDVDTNDQITTAYLR